MSEASDYVNHNTITDSSTGETNSQTTANSSNSSTTENIEHFERTEKGNKGILTNTQNTIKAYRDNIIAIDREIIEELAILFMRNLLKRRKNMKQLETLSFHKFCVKISPLPENYMNSLSYIELIYWLCNYLEKTIIPTVNANSEAVTELQNLYIELKNYVDSYFTNLDVQKEINNKLDSLAEDGTLYTLMQPYFDTINTTLNTQNSKILAIENKVNATTNINPLVATSISEMTDTSRIYVLTTDNNWYYHNGTSWVSGGIYNAIQIANNSIDTEKTTFIERKIISANIFNKNDFTDNSLISATGEISANSNGYGTSGFINIATENIGKTLYFSRYNTAGFYDAINVFRVVAYNSNKSVLSSSDNYINQFVIPSNCSYIRFSFSQSNKDTFQARFDGVVQDYSEYTEIYNFLQKINGENINNNSIDGDKLINNSISENKLDNELKEKIKKPVLLDTNLLLPNKIFMLEEEPLRIYKSSLIQPQKNIEKIRIGLLSEFNFYTDKKQPFVEFLNEKIDISSNEISETLKIRMMNDELGTIYGKNLSVVKCNATNVTNKNPKINMFGDSTTYGSLTLPIRQTMNLYGITPTWIGTAETGDPANTLAEARSGYCYANYIGLRTLGPSDTLAEFPNFLKVATETDKTNHPDWCYTRTVNGSAKEKTYSEVVQEKGNISQNFYIFDYANYLSINSFSTPDIVTLRSWYK